MSNYSKEIADTIVAQLGGSRWLKAIIGAHSFTYGGGSESPLYPHLTFRFKARARNKAEAIRIEYLEGSDLYRVTFLKMEYQKIGTLRFPVGVTEVSVHEGAYVDQLKELIGDETGLALSL